MEEAATSLKPIIGEDTMILPLQNGANNVEKLIKILPEKNVLAGLCFIVSFIESPGKIKHASFEPLITFGEIDNIMSPRIKNCRKFLIIPKLPITFRKIFSWRSGKIPLYSYHKRNWGLTRVPIGKIRESDYLFDVMKSQLLK